MDMIEVVAKAMYWNRVSPNMGTVTLDVAVRRWEDLDGQHEPGIQVWHCKQFWIDASRAAIEAMRMPTEAMQKAWIGPEAWDQDALEVWQAMIDAALSTVPPGEI